VGILIGRGYFSAEGSAAVSSIELVIGIGGGALLTCFDYGTSDLPHDSLG